MPGVGYSTTSYEDSPRLRIKPGLIDIDFMKKRRR